MVKVYDSSGTGVAARASSSMSNHQDGEATVRWHRGCWGGGGTSRIQIMGLLRMRLSVRYLQRFSERHHLQTRSAALAPFSNICWRSQKRSNPPPRHQPPSPQESNMITHKHLQPKVSPSLHYSVMQRAAGKVTPPAPPPTLACPPPLHTIGSEDPPSPTTKDQNRFRPPGRAAQRRPGVGAVQVCH